MSGVLALLRAAPRSLVAAAMLAALEGLTLVGLAVFLVVKEFVDEAKSLLGVFGGAALALVGAAVLLGLIPWLLRGERWARTPIVVLQILWLPVGFSLGFQAGRPEIGIPLLAVALLALGLLTRAEARLAFESHGPASGDGEGPAGDAAAVLGRSDAGRRPPGAGARATPRR